MLTGDPFDIMLLRLRSASKGVVDRELETEFAMGGYPMQSLFFPLLFRWEAIFQVAVSK